MSHLVQQFLTELLFCLAHVLHHFQLLIKGFHHTGLPVDTPGPCWSCEVQQPFAHPMRCSSGSLTPPQILHHNLDACRRCRCLLLGCMERQQGGTFEGLLYWRTHQYLHKPPWNLISTPSSPAVPCTLYTVWSRPRHRKTLQISAEVSCLVPRHT